MSEQPRMIMKQTVPMSQAIAAPSFVDQLKAIDCAELLAKRFLEVWHTGEGDLHVEVRNSEMDPKRRKRPMMKISGGPTDRWKEEEMPNRRI